jgi:hypothetical protein
VSWNEPWRGPRRPPGAPPPPPRGGPPASLSLLPLYSYRRNERGGGRGAGPVITAEAIAGTGASNAYEAVQMLRPQFLRSRGSVGMRAGATGDQTLDSNATGTEIVVYVNGTPAGGVQALQAIPATSVLEIRQVSGLDATTKYGTGHGAGVLEVRTR